MRKIAVSCYNHMVGKIPPLHTHWLMMLHPLPDKLVLMLCLVMLALGAIACEVEKRVVRDGWGDLRSMAQPNARKDSMRNREGATTEPASAPQGWAILLESFEGPNASQRARELEQRLRKEAYVPDLWLHAAGGKVHVVRGRYPLPDVDAAQRDLRQSRMLMLDGLRPYENVQLMPLGGAAAANSANPQNPRGWDVKLYPGMYTLQIGFYDENFGKDFRDAAEKAVATLRQNGEDAYYYHGPNRSLVTIGLFTDADFVKENNVLVYGPRVRQLQERFKYNLGNGLTLIQKFEDHTSSEQPSFLVRVN